MVFSSYQFLLLFLPFTLVGFYGLRHFGQRNHSVTFLLFASAIFYSVWNIWHFSLLAASIIVNYAIGIALLQSKNKALRKALIYIGVIGNLSLIFWFKYLDFTLSNIAAFTGTTHTFYNLILPLGISFFTFQQIAYLVDCYQTSSAERRLRDYALFVSFFPQLIAGPIVHHGVTRPQFQKIARDEIDLNGVATGLLIFALGLGKKVLIADPIARAIAPIFEAASAGETFSLAMSAFVTIGYTLQIYFDFSGYCDMAIGLGLMFGIRLPVNFNSPYKSKSIIEFWRRWHITLSNFLRDYVYIPLGGNRRGEFFRLRNIFLTMLIGGIWHGAAWTFIIWGAIHASLITANHAARIWWPALDQMNGRFASIIKQTFLLVSIMIAWIYFRADTLGAANSIIAGFTSLSGPEQTFDPFILILMGVASLMALFAPSALEITGYIKTSAKEGIISFSNKVAHLARGPVGAFATALLLTAGIAVAWRPAIFIYYNF